MMPLADGYGREHTYLRLAVTDRCNLRCHYCRPPEVQERRPEELLSDEEIVRAAQLFVRLGIAKIRLTGGEPTLRPHLDALVARLAALPGLRTLAMTTNGLLLREQATRLRRAGLSPRGVNISVDSLRRERVCAITGSDAHDEILAGVDAARAAGFSPVKLNVVVMARTNDDELCDFVAFAIEKDLNVRFIEYMPFRGNGWEPAGLVTYEEMKARIDAGYTLVPLPQEAGIIPVAKDFAIAGAAGKVSFISPLSDDFCGLCSRLRLTADGAVKTCLLHPAEFSLRDLLREGASEEEMTEAIRAAVAAKPAGHPPVEELCRARERSMVEIGG